MMEARDEPREGANLLDAAGKQKFDGKSETPASILSVLSKGSKAKYLSTHGLKAVLVECGACMLSCEGCDVKLAPGNIYATGKGHPCCKQKTSGKGKEQGQPAQGSPAAVETRPILNLADSPAGNTRQKLALGGAARCVLPHSALFYHCVVQR